MPENTLTAFSSRLRISCAAGYAIGGIFTVCVVAGIVPEVVRLFNHIVFQGIRFPHDSIVLLLLLLISLVIFILSVFCWASIFRQKLVINADGIIYQNAFQRMELKWDEVERLSCSNQYFRLVYVAKKYQSTPAWLRVVFDDQPIIDMRSFSNEKIVPGSPYGPIACAIQACAPRLLEHLPPGTQADHQPTGAKSSSPTFASPGILAGLISVVAGTTIFSILEQFVIFFQEQSVGRSFTIGSTFLLIFPLSCAFSCVPGMIAGKLLEIYLHWQQRKGKLTRKGSVTAGMALAALAGCSICFLVIRFMFSIEPDMAGVNYVKMEFLEYFWMIVGEFRFEIAIVLLITSICGGLAGGYIFNHLVRKPISNLLSISG